MKTLITILSMMVLTIAIGTAYADEMPVFGGTKDVGTEIYHSAFAAPGETLADKEVVGSAAGGISREDENTMIWDNLLKPTGLVLE